MTDGVRPTARNVAAYSSYALTLRDLARQTSAGNLEPTSPRIAAALDGQAATALRDLIRLPTRRRYGAFFTPRRLARLMVAPWARHLDENSQIYDPACGAADLLLAAAEHLPIGKTLGKTLERWEEQLAGRDLHPPFIRAAKARLLLMATARLGKTTLPDVDPDRLFRQVRVGDGLSDEAVSVDATHLVMNPPFSRVRVRTGWSRGGVSAAAVFVDSHVAPRRHGEQFVALLPDVLRSGTNYQRWRDVVAGQLDGDATADILGRFDDDVDIDVFILRGRITERSSRHLQWWPPTSAMRVGDRFKVSVGAVVPHRDPKIGAWRPFADTNSVPPWKEVLTRDLNRRRFAGASFRTPFVVVRRTSAAGDSKRLVASIVRGGGDVAVENHLLVLRPLDQTLTTCRELVAFLETGVGDEWLDKRIRCRHLTVTTLRDCPWRR